MPEQWKEHPEWFIINICVIMFIGIVGNLFALISVKYVSVKYKSQFPDLLTLPTVLLLHLSFCDLLYCSLGLPPFVIGTFTDYM